MIKIRISNFYFCPIVETVLIYECGPRIQKGSRPLVYAINVISILLLFLSFELFYVLTRIQIITELFKHYDNIEYVRIMYKNVL